MSEILTREQYERIVQSARDNAFVPGMGAVSLWQVANSYGAALDALDAALERERVLKAEVESWLTEFRAALVEHTNHNQPLRPWHFDEWGEDLRARAALAATRTADAAVEP